MSRASVLRSGGGRGFIAGKAQIRARPGREAAMIPLGVGLVWWPGLDALCRDPKGPVEVVELEPETFWRMDGEAFDSSLAGTLAGLAQPKLLHGVGAPFAGSLPAPPGHLPAFRREIARLGPAWASDHLAFNRSTLDGETANTAIFLPPQ